MAVKEPTPSAIPSAIPSATEEFARQAAEKPPGILREFVDFLIYNKAWWLTPIVLVLLLLGVLVFLLSSGAAPFVYTMF
jgi:Family of unknown function (DUF5989)